MGGEKVADHIWEQQQDRIEEIILPDGDDDPTNNPVQIHTHRYTHYRVWLGANFGEPDEVRNPNPEDRSADDLPVPYDFNYGALSIGESGPTSDFSMLGVAYRDNHTNLWTDRFHSLGQQRNVAVSQARIFNNHSFDLWTQMWHAQLEPVNSFEGWLDLIDDTVDQAGDEDGTDPETISEIQRYLRAVEPPC